MGVIDLSSMKLRRLLLGLGIVALAVIAELTQVSLPMVDSLDRFLYDSRMRLQPPKPSSRIIIVDIDEKSLAAQGRWPWSREQVARLTQILARDGGAVGRLDHNVQSRLFRRRFKSASDRQECNADARCSLL
jgi:adenylate cyclase